MKTLIAKMLLCACVFTSTLTAKAINNLYNDSTISTEPSRYAKLSMGLPEIPATFDGTSVTTSSNLYKVTGNIDGNANLLIIEGDNGKKGIYSPYKKSVVIPVEFDTILYKYDFCILRIGNNWGLYDIKLGKGLDVKYPPRKEGGHPFGFFTYDNGDLKRRNIVVVRDNNSSFLYNVSTQSPILSNYDSFYVNKSPDYSDEPFDDYVYPKKNGAQGCYDISKKKMIIEPKLYSSIRNILTVQGGGFIVKSKATGKWGITDTEGKMVMPCKYGYIWPVSSGGIKEYYGGDLYYISANPNTRASHLINGKGIKIFNLSIGQRSVEYSDLNNVMIIKDQNTGKYGAASTLTGKLLVPTIYDGYEIYECRKGRMWFGKNNENANATTVTVFNTATGARVATRTFTESTPTYVIAAFLKKYVSIF